MSEKGWNRPQIGHTVASFKHCSIPVTTTIPPEQVPQQSVVAPSLDSASPVLYPARVEPQARYVCTQKNCFKEK